MGHALNHGLTTNAKGASWDQLRLKCTDGSGTVGIDEDCGAGLVASIAHTSTGKYTLQMAVPYPAKLITCQAQLAPASETTAFLNARYKQGSYSNTTGTFVILVSNAAGTGASDPASGDEIHIDITTGRYTAKP